MNYSLATTTIAILIARRTGLPGNPTSALGIRPCSPILLASTDLHRVSVAECAWVSLRYNPGLDPPTTGTRLFWGILEGVLASVLLLAGGLKALQTASITIGLPFCIIVIGMCVERVAAISLSYVLSDYRPRLSVAAWRELFDFSKWMLIGNIFPSLSD